MNSRYSNYQTKKVVIILTTKTINVKCPFCKSEKVSKNGHNKTGKQVYNCKNPECKHHNFVEEYTYKVYNPQVREQVLKMAVDCTCTRATQPRFLSERSLVTDCCCTFLGNSLKSVIMISEALKSNDSDAITGSIAS